MYPLENKVVWLTGASSGIGEALAVELAARGAKLAISARRGDLLETLAAKIRSNGGTVMALPADVNDPQALAGAVSKIGESFGPVDLLIANAGTHLFTKPEAFDSKEYLDLMFINYGGMLKSIEAVLPGMIARKSGYIAGVASLAGYRGLPRAGAYGASKAAMINFLESLRFHLKPHGIAVSVVNPGFVKTPLTDKNDFKMPFLIDSPQAARSICNGLERQKREISFPFPFNWALKIGKLLPAPVYERLVDRMW